MTFTQVEATGPTTVLLPLPSAGFLVEIENKSAIPVRIVAPEGREWALAAGEREHFIVAVPRRSFLERIRAFFAGEGPPPATWMTNPKKVRV